MTSRAVHIAIGNSDDKLSQNDWHKYCAEIDRAIDVTCRYNGTQVHGRWYSLPNEQWQNACWSIAVEPECEFVLVGLRNRLITACRAYGQESIAWTEGVTTFVSGTEELRTVAA